MLLVSLLIAGAGAATGLVLRDSATGNTTIAVDQAILIDYTSFGPGDVSGDADEVLVSVSDDGTEWAVHLEANNGDIIYIDLPVVNLAEKKIVAELYMWGNSPYTFGVDPLFYWSDRNHDGKWSHEETVLDQRPTTDKLELERADIVQATGWTDYDNFTGNHWFFDGSYAGGGTYGFGGIYGSSYDDNIFSDYDGEDPEAILLDGNSLGELDAGLLDGTGDTIVTAGRAALYEDLGSYAIGRLLYNDAGAPGGWNTDEDIFISVDGDAFWSTYADVLIDGDGTGSPDAGGATALNVGDPLLSFDADDDVYYYDPGAGDIFDGNNDALWYDDGDDGRYATSGASVSANTAVTTLATTLNPGFNIEVDGSGSSPVLLENSGAITGGTLSTVGLEANAIGFVSGDIVKVGTKYFIVDTKYSPATAQASTITLIGDVGVGGDTLKATTIYTQNYAIGGSTGVYINGGQTMDADGSRTATISDNSDNPVNADALDANEIYMIDDDGTYDASSVFVIIDNDAGNPTTTVDILGDPGASLPNDYEFWPVTPTGNANSANVDDMYLDGSTDIVNEINAKISGATVAYGPAGFANRYKFDSASTASGSAVEITAYTGTGTDVTGGLYLALADAEWGGGDVAFRDSGGNLVEDVTTGTQLVTSATTPFSYNDGELAAANGVFDLGEDVYEEESGGANTYTTGANLPETVVYQGAGPNVAAGGAQFDASAASYLLDSDNIMYRDTDHDDAYDFGEPLLYTGSSDIDVEGQLTAAVTVLARADSTGVWTIDNTNDMFRLETDYDGGAPAGAVTNHHYYFVDDNNDQAYSDGEAIIDQIGGSDLIRLEKSDLAPATDFVIHHGLANLLPLPVVQFDGGSGYWKFEVPNVNILGDPLEIRITIAIEDAAPTGFYTLHGRIRSVNY